MVAQAFQPAGLGDFPVAQSGTGKFRHQQTRMSALQNLPTKKNQAARVGGLNGFGWPGNYFNFASAALRASKFGRSFGVGVCSLYCTTPCLSITNAARAAVSPTPASIGNTTL